VGVPLSRVLQEDGSRARPSLDTYLMFGQSF